MALTIKDFIAVLHLCKDVMVENREYLIQLDGVAGDGDLGIYMCDGFTAICEMADASTEEDLGKFLYTVGKTMNAHAPSSLGTLISVGFMETGKKFKGRTEIEGAEIADFFEAFEAAIMSRGGAKPGDKTFLDGFDPAVQVLKAKAAADYKAALVEAADAAAKGSAATVGMLAKFGRIAVRGEASREILDPGSVVAVMLTKAFADAWNA